MQGQVKAKPIIWTLECPTSESLFGLPPNQHYDPVTSDNGDAVTTGPNDPGLAGLTTSNTNAGAAAIRPFQGTYVALSLFGVLLACI
jgi:hypothetical protein